MRTLLAAAILLASTTAAAGTACDEWASMVQVLVVRWQNDPQFANKTNVDIKKELLRTMGSHPEVDTAAKWVDFAYKNKGSQYQDVWKKAYDLCSAKQI